MSSFKDSEGREWSPRVTCLTIDLFERDTGVGILREASNGLRSADLGGGTDKIDPAKMLDFLSALVGGKAGNLVRFVWASVHRQADERKIKYEDFADALDGEALASAGPVLMEEFSRFFRSAAGRIKTAAE